MYNLHQACIREYYNQRQKNEDAKMELMGARYDKEMYKKAAMAREHDMEKAMREQSRRIEDYEEKLRVIQGFIEASRSMADRAREEAESNVHRLEAERFQQLDKILSLRLALEEMQAQAPAQNIVNVPPPPPPEEPQPPNPEEADQLVPVIEVEEDPVPPADPEIDLYAHENLEGFDVDIEDDQGEVPARNQQFAWANANADGLDPQGYGPIQQWGEEEPEGEEEEEDPEEMEGNSGISTSASDTSRTWSDPRLESGTPTRFALKKSLLPLGVSKEEEDEKKDEVLPSMEPAMTKSTAGDMQVDGNRSTIYASGDIRG
ncbi:proline-, glutamic acid- and leucine-rich protein 1-like [Setaria italica]|uniref:proline-, glutamic acid- and leucine-rich protein 1-like n=1 Tax=Setaria italica TaxID=4555 RepID=UPI000350FD7F|nr:proline-, glutamic acid- and leucine-rich protein 1-like [Setaria italica]